MVENLHGNRRITADHGELLCFDKRQRLAGIEVMHHDDLSPGCGVDDHDGETSRGVKERHVQQTGVLDALAFEVNIAGSESKGCTLTNEEKTHQVREGVAVRTYGALRFTGCSRRVKHRGVIVRFEGDVGRGGRRVNLSEKIIETDQLNS